LAQELVRGRRVQARPDKPGSEDRLAAIGELGTGEAIVERDAGREVVGAVAVEVADSERPGEAVAGLRVESEQILVAEAPGANGRKGDCGDLGRGGGREKERGASE
jgi:hypothetical protein